MGVDYDGVAGIGIELNRNCNLEMFNIQGLDICEIEEKIEPIVKGTPVKFRYAGCSYSEDFRFYLMARKPITGINEFVVKMNDFGFNITKQDLVFIEDLICW